MASHALIKSALTTHAPLQALVGARIYPDLAPEGAAQPFVVFKRADLQRERGLDNTIHATREVFEVECWADRRSLSLDVAEAVLGALDAVDLAPETVGPDQLDPELLDRAAVVSVEVWS